MKEILKKIVPLALCSTMLLTACTSETDGDSAEATEPPIPGDTVVLQIGDYEVTAQEYASYIATMRAQAEMYIGTTNEAGESIWEDEESEELISLVLEDALDGAKQVYAIKAIIEENGIEVTEEIEAQVDEEYAAVVEQNGGEETFPDVLKQNNTTEELLRENITLNVLMAELEEKLYGENGTEKVSDDVILEAMNETYYLAKHILFSTTDTTTGEALEQSVIDEKKAAAEEALEKVNAGEDFDTLMTSLSEDPGTTSAPNGYLFTDGDMVAPFEEATKALGENETSGIVESDFGYHIIKRLAIDQEYLDLERETVENMYYVALLEEAVLEATESLEVVETEDFDKVTVANSVLFMQ